MWSTHRARIERVTHRIGRGPLSIVQASDVHAGGRGVPRAFERLVAELPAHPDLVVVTGDSVFQHDPEDAAVVARILLEHLRPRIGAFAILGNHDYHVYGPPGHKTPPDYALGDAVAAALGEGGFTVLRNRWVEPQPGLIIAGADDLEAVRFQPEPTLGGAPEGLRVALVHHPEAALALLTRYRADVVLCGHTHGGQVRLPRLPVPFVPIAIRRYAAGRFLIRGASMYVSRGFGYSHLPVRAFAPPELTLHAIV